MSLPPTTKKIFASILLIACFNLFIGCHRYYMPVKINTSTPEVTENSLKKLNEENRYFILRKGTHSYKMSQLLLDQSNMTLTADLTNVPAVHQLYIQNKNGKYRYSKGLKQDVVLQEVHLFAGDTTSVDTSNRYTLSLADVQKIEVLQFDQKKTNSSYVLGGIGVTVGVGLVILAIAALASPPPPPPEPTPEGSCPYISTFDGKKFTLQGEIYSAAIYPSLQKEDYLPLEMQSFQNDWCIKISNDLKEVQHTDFANLTIAEHSKDVRLLIDPQGKLHSIQNLHSPLTAFLNNRKDVSAELKKEDYRSCLFNDNQQTQSRQDVYLKFPNDAKHTNGKLVLKARSSSWFLYVYDELAKGFGTAYNKWMKEEQKKPVSELNKWTKEQHIPLSISVKTADGWKEINEIKTIGPLLNREVVIPLDLPANNYAEVKISTGYMFWELDYAGIDYSNDDNFTVKEISPYEAINENGVNVLPELASADKKFLVQPNVGDYAIVKYKVVSPEAGMEQSFFLHSSGYYDHPRYPSGSPKVAFLKSFEKPGAMSAFSKQKFLEAWNNVATTKN